MKIALLGGGHGCYAAAADLSERGHEVRWWRRDAAAFAPVLQSGEVELRDTAGTRRVRIAQPTVVLSEAVRGAELILIPGPATAQADIAAGMAPYLQNDQVVFLPPGTFGSVIMDSIARTAGSTARVTYAETGTLPYLARKHGPESVAITMRAVRLPTGAYPAAHSGHALGVIRKAYPSVLPCEDALSAALMNAGPIIHPPLILMNAGPLQHFEQWDIHNEGTQASVRAVTNQLDAERIAVREAIGYAAPHFPLSDHYNSDRWMYGDAHKRLVDSGDWREHIDLHTHRYMVEDTVLGLAFLVSVARWADIEVPIASGLLAMAGAILGRDLRYGPRTLEALKLDGLTPAAMRQFLQTGRP
jgi:opine dehydrogenase